MAHINHTTSKYMLNLLHAVPAFVDKSKCTANAIIEVVQGSINKYELITESGQLKLDRVGYSSLGYPFTYGAIPMTYDYDNDPLDVCIINITEALVPGCLAEIRIIGVVKFIDGDEVDDKIIAVLADDKRSDHITDIAQLGEYFQKETTYYWENYKALKKPGTGKVVGYYGHEEALHVVEECIERYLVEFAELSDK